MIVPVPATHRSVHSSDDVDAAERNNHLLSLEGMVWRFVRHAARSTKVRLKIADHARRRFEAPLDVASETELLASLAPVSHIPAIARN
jgi:hypothetical protein